MIDYTIFYKCDLPINEEWPSDAKWDIFISAFTEAERVKRIYDKITAQSKHWLVFPEYKFRDDQLPANAFVSPSRDEAEYVRSFWESEIGDIGEKTICIDITGFIRPYLIFLTRWLLECGVKRFDALYTEPDMYGKREKTRFSSEVVEEVRQVAGFEGNHITDTSNDFLIIGAGYDHQLITVVAENKESSQKIQIFGLPSLRADMYQENVLRAHRAEEAVGHDADDPTKSYYSPANDPFITASTLRKIVKKISSKKAITNLYLSPLATKPQVLGFALYYLTERRNNATSLIFPFCDEYNSETTSGLSRIWKYTVELPAG